MTGRDRTTQEHAGCGLPTRTIRVTSGKRTIEKEMGSGQTDGRLIEWMSDEEAERMVSERAAVNL